MGRAGTVRDGGPRGVQITALAGEVLFTEVPRIGLLRTSSFGHSTKLAVSPYFLTMVTGQ